MEASIKPPLFKLIRADLLPNDVSPILARFSKSVNDLMQVPEKGGNLMRKPRKYQLKSTRERRSTIYKLKREKNNDAVRRSRDKTKFAQKQREERLSFLEKESRDKAIMITQLESKLAICEVELKAISALNMKLEEELAVVCITKTCCSCNDR